MLIPVNKSLDILVDDKLFCAIGFLSGWPSLWTGHCVPPSYFWLFEHMVSSFFQEKDVTRNRRTPEDYDGQSPRIPMRYHYFIGQSPGDILMSNQLVELVFLYNFIQRYLGSCLL